jgi:hypothetical protein
MRKELRGILLCVLAASAAVGQAEIRDPKLPNGLSNWLNGHSWLLLLLSILSLLGVSAALKETLGKYIVGEGAGSLFANIGAIISYRKSLGARYGRASLPFRPGKPIDVGQLYIPLTAVTGFGAVVEGPGLDAEAALGDHRRVVVLAPPGGGKSMLLRHIATQYSAVGMRRLRNLRVPILFELHRLNVDSRPLKEQLATASEGRT